ncbi:MAG TPA: response regulator transcription factor [Kofleriaceae bacterium]|nr:response regulator transcription factor [Kofleriaceae bacterium]HMG53373.1 response regulator transcription factor [Kofleriaceae bacterium]
MIRVFLADDERLIRQGLRKLLELDRAIEVVGEAADGAEALALVPAAAVDVLLLDIRMPRRSGLEVLDQLGDRRPPTLILTTFDDAELLLGSVRAGARGFLNKDVSLDELIAAIRALARGDTWFQPALTASLRRGIEARARDAAPAGERLTDRERDVLRLMAGGYSNREIADVLATAEGTVKNQVSSILAKLGVRDRTRAVLKAIETGVI